MEKLAKRDIENALRIVSATIYKCEKAKLKFNEGTSQNTLLKNRINALYVSKAFLTGENSIAKFSTQELIDAIRPVSSIISKCEKAKTKFAEGSSNFIRLKDIINAMVISKEFILNEIEKRNK
jgi:hypothetical protein